jgi:hypothetical protein
MPFSNIHTWTTLEATSEIFNQLLSLELSCFFVDDVQKTLRNLGPAVGSHDLVKALSTLKNTWPPQGHLIVSINAESHNQKFWFPNTSVSDSVGEREPV